MACFILFIRDGEVLDAEAIMHYRKTVGSTVVEGMRSLAMTEDPVSLEGDPFRAVVLIEFPDRDTAEAWYNSEEYRPLRELRMKAAPGRAILFEGRDLIG
jgi:uncharacterized protein (DUF1330 family)